MSNINLSKVEDNTKEKDWTNLITKFIKGNRPVKEKKTIHCNDYSSVICLRCDKCWLGGGKSKEENIEK